MLESFNKFVGGKEQTSPHRRPSRYASTHQDTSMSAAEGFEKFKQAVDDVKTLAAGNARFLNRKKLKRNAYMSGNDQNKADDLLGRVKLSIDQVAAHMQSSIRIHGVEQFPYSLTEKASVLNQIERKVSIRQSKGKTCLSFDLGVCMGLVISRCCLCVLRGTTRLCCSVSVIATGISLSITSIAILVIRDLFIRRAINRDVAKLTPKNNIVI